MIPLWMTASRPVQSRWGWALSDGGVPVGGPAGMADPGGVDRRAGGRPAVCAARSATERVPSAARTRQISPSATSATPAES